MVKTLLGVFIILHGLVHLLYSGHSLRFFELEKGLLWPDSSWALIPAFNIEQIRPITAVVCTAAAIGFVLGGTALLFKLNWWRLPVSFTAVVSSLLFILMWDGSMQGLSANGGIGILINVGLLAAVFLV